MPLYLCSEQSDESFRGSLFLALEGQRIEYFGAGGSLRSAIKSCECCLVIATRNAVNSASCWIEIGGFVIANIRIFFLLSDDVTEKDIPPQFLADNLISRDLRLLTNEIKTEISKVRGKRSLEAKKEAEELLQVPKLVSHLTIDVFNNFISSAIQSKESIVHLILLLREAFPERVGENYSQPLFDNPDLLGFALPLLKNLLGKPQEEVQPLAERFFGHSFQFISTSGEEYWGFALESSYFQTAYENCLLIHFQNSSVDAAFLSPGAGVGISSDQDGDSFYYYEPIICSSGSIEIGEISEIKPRDYLFREGAIPFFGG